MVHALMVMQSEITSWVVGVNSNHYTYFHHVRNYFAFDETTSNQSTLEQCVIKRFVFVTFSRDYLFSRTLIVHSTTGINLQ